MIGWTIVDRAMLPAGGPLRSGAETRLPAPNAAVAAILFQIAAASAPLTVERAVKISRLDHDDAGDFLDRMVMDGWLIKAVDGLNYLGCGR